LDEPLLDLCLAEVGLNSELEVRSGGEVRGELKLMNRGTRALTLWTNGQVIGRLVDLRAREVVGGFAGAMTLPGVAFRAAPGEAVNVPLFIGTDSFRGTLGYAVPPGRWAVEAALDLRDAGQWRTPLLPIKVLA
jgi:hypothetical protein